jgi:hypothetical protein
MDMSSQLAGSETGGTDLPSCWPSVLRRPITCIDASPPKSVQRCEFRRFCPPLPQESREIFTTEDSLSGPDYMGHRILFQYHTAPCYHLLPELRKLADRKKLSRSGRKLPRSDQRMPSFLLELQVNHRGMRHFS